MTLLVSGARITPEHPSCHIERTMETKPHPPRAIFDLTATYEIPAFQRPYVWNEEDQWAPLWADITRVADSIASQLQNGVELEKVDVVPHFLGAVVVKRLFTPAADPNRLSVIDGQQRLTTLQILLDALQVVAEEARNDLVADTLLELVTNQARRFEGTSKRFKLLPARVDRPAFERVMDNDLDLGDAGDSRIARAHQYFQATAREWLNEHSELDSALEILSETVQQHLLLVLITLDDKDDDQLIFETLNDRGTPLLAADLIKNYVFLRGERLKANVDAWAETFWDDFDDDWWRDQVQQGRLFRSRIDLFLQYWLTMREQREVPAEGIFRRFRDSASVPLDSLGAAEDFLGQLRRDADLYRRLIEFDDSSRASEFYRRVVEGLELGATLPVLLWVASDNNAVSEAQIGIALDALESWVVRRTILRRTMKDVNNLMLGLLRRIAGAEPYQVGESAAAYLREQTADSRVWPSDQELRDELPGMALYGNLRQNRIRLVLEQVEEMIRTDRSEPIAVPARLELEHVMPQGWRAHWDEGTLTAEQRSQRDHLVHTIGNLTLLAKKLNASLSNRPWTDDESTGYEGIEAGLGKRSLIDRYSLLLLSKEITLQHPTAWTDDDIRRRSQQMADRIARRWPR